MPIAAGPQAYQSQFPSFMSVFNIESQEAQDRCDVSSGGRVVPRLEKPDPSSLRQPEQNPTLHDTQHRHNDSTSTQTSESTDSSPTTTVSTTDSSSIPDPSPASSPESPVTIVPLSSFSSPHFLVNSMDDLAMTDKLPLQHTLINFDRPMTSPSPKRPRNAKGLALRLPSSAGASPVQEEQQSVSGPASPSFFRPLPMKPRKKPSILSLQTSANASTLPVTQLAGLPPPTPGGFQDHALRHVHSTPTMLFSPGPTAGPEGGMQLPAFERSRISGLSSTFRKPSMLKEMGVSAAIEEEDSPIKHQIATRTMADIRGDVFDAPASQEDAKSPGYPNGPVAIYEPNIYLYLEPTAAEASQFDVVLNVASEVRNPFNHAIANDKQQSERSPQASSDQVTIDRDDIPEPSTAMSTATFRTAFEWLPDVAQQTPTEASPTTPKPAAKSPEYIHVPWEHSTDISTELMDLCELIDARNKEGKRVLIHCQQGASRSASLIIAYGMYMDRSLSVNDAYVAAQKKSKWISPNMKLMYALQDFKKDLDKKHTISIPAYKRGTGRSPTRHRTTLSADTIELSPPLTAPLPSDKDGLAKAGSPLEPSPRARGNSTPNFGDISPGPSSAPSSLGWDLKPLATRPNTDSDFQTPPINSLPSAESPLTPLKSLSRLTLAPSPVSQQAALGFGMAAKPSHSGFATHRAEHRSKVTLPSLSLRPSTATTTTRKEEIAEIPKLESVVDIQSQYAERLGVPSDTNQDPFRRREIPGRSLRLARSFDRSQMIETQAAQEREPALEDLMSPRVQEFPVRSLRHALSFDRSHKAEPTPNKNREATFEDLMSPRVAEFTVNPFHNALPFERGHAVHTAEPSFDELMSPRVAEFATGFDFPRVQSTDAVAATFGLTPLMPEAPPLGEEDPRSPAMKGEAPIIRSIDDVL